MHEKEWTAVMTDNILECHDAVTIWAEEITDYRLERKDKPLLDYLADVFEAVYSDGLYALSKMAEDGDLCPEITDLIQDAIDSISWREVARAVIDRIDKLIAAEEIGE